VSNRRKAKPPARRDAAVDALLAATRCESCGSTKALRRWRRGGWEISSLHLESCGTRLVNGRTVSPHVLSENAVRAARQDGHDLAYLAYSDDSGGVVVGGEVSLS
jgi:hypothetical protein